MQKLPAVKINVKLKNPQSPAYFNQQLEASRNGFNQKQLRSTKINRFLYTTAPDYEPEGREFPAVAGLRAHHIFQQLPKPGAPGLYLRVDKIVDVRFSACNSRRKRSHVRPIVPTSCGRGPTACDLQQRRGPQIRGTNIGHPEQNLIQNLRETTATRPSCASWSEIRRIGRGAVTHTMGWDRKD